MDESGSPALEVGLEINFGDAFAELLRFNNVVDDATAKAIKEFTAVERASRGMLDLGAATIQARTFGNAATQSGQEARKAFADAERAGERLVSQMQRQASVFGKNSQEIRAMKVETAALTAEQQGLTELAGRLRAQESSLYADEFAAVRRSRVEAENAAQAKQAASLEAAAAAEREEQSVRGAQRAYEMFNAVAKQKMAIHREQQASEAATTTAADNAATVRLAREHDQLAAAVRGSHAAQEANAAAAEQLRMSTDPLYAATSRLNAEIAESTRLYYAGATAPAEYGRQQQVLTGRLQEVERQHNAVNRGFGTVGTTGKLAGHHMQNLAFQFQDLGVQMAMAAQSGRPLQMAMMALFQQGTQINGIMSQAGIGIRGVGAAFVQMSKSVLLATLTNPILLGIAAAITVVAGSIKLLQKSANDGADMKAYAASLGLTAREIRNLDNLTVTYGDTTKAVFQVAGRAIWGAIGPAVTSVWDIMMEWTAWIGTGVKAAVNFMIGGFVGAYNMISKTWAVFPAVLGDIFYSAVNAAIGAINGLIKASVSGVNGFIDTANGILEKAGLKLPTLDVGEIAEVENQYAGAGKKFGQAVRITMDKAMGVDYVGGAASAIDGAVKDQARKNAQDRIRAQAEEKGYLDPEKAKTPKADKRGEQLAREAEAIEAQIRNLYALADAYRVSGAAALVAEARVKAESEAIKKRGDIEEFVNRQIRLSIAQRVSDAAKATAAVRDQMDAQRGVNDLVASGLVPAERAAELVKDQIADLSLLAAIEVAQQRGLVTEAERATQALADQRDMRAAANLEASRAKVLADTAAATDQLERLQVEARLINATNKERAVAIAQLEVEQFLRANPGIPADEAGRYRDTKVAVAGMSAELAIARTDADLLLASMSAIADQASVTAGIMSGAFGNVGDVLGGVIANFADYRVQQQQLATEVANKTKTQAEADKMLGTLQTRNTAAAISGVKSLFKEKSTAFKVMSAIEMGFAAWQAAETIASIVRDVTKTASSVANSGVRTTANTIEGGSKIFASLGPWGFPVVAAMVAVLAALGASALGGGGGSSGPAMPTPEDLQDKQGTGSVLGDAAAKSESITRSLELVASNTNRDLEYSNAMLTALRSIDFGISKMAGTIARQISVSGSLFDTSNLGLGSSGSGGFLGIGAKSTTKSLFDLGLNLNSGSVADILANGLGGSSYQTTEEIKKKSGFLGIGGSTKTSFSTSSGALDSDISNAIVGVISGLRSGILSAADVVGLQGAQAILDSFNVSLGKISLTGLSGEEIEEQLNAVFSKVGDDMAGAVFPALSGLQLVGEGLFETFARVAREYQVVDVALRSIGKEFGAVGVGSLAARDGLVRLFGSLDEFAEATSFFRDNFLSEAEQIAPVAAAVRAELARLGMAGIATRDQFKQAVLGLDLTTAAGRVMYASLLAIAPAFDKTLEYFDQANKATADGLKKTADQFGGFVASLTKYRESLFAADVAQGDAYRLLRARFGATATLAASGDATALGGLESSGKAFLDAARNNASTREDYLRDVAMVARGVDAGIFAADAKADYAQLQLDALTNAVSILGTINANTAATAMALGAEQTSAAGTVTAAGASSAASAPRSDNSSAEDLRLAVVAMREEIAQLRADNNAGHAATAGNTGRMARKLDDVTAASGGDALSMASAVP